MSFGELIQTKIHVPVLKEAFVRRPRLIELLHAAVDRQLTRVWAPIGFGKTTLLTEWAQTLPEPPAWLSLDEADNQSLNFWAYFVGAIHKAYPDTGASAMEMMQSASGIPVKAILKTLINDIYKSRQSVLMVLDDFHLVDNPAIHEVFQFFMDHLPPQMNLIIASRKELPFSVARLRMAGQIGEIGVDALKFTVRETRAFARGVMGKRLAEEAADELASRCEGWAAGLQIAALAARESNSEAIPTIPQVHAQVIDYFMDTVFSCQPAHIRSFLQETAILSRLAPALCDAVTGRSDSEEVLKQLCAGQMFVIALDRKSSWYRYHQMFADALKARLHKTQPDRAATLHARAALWFKKNKMPNEAIHHAIAGRDWDLAVQLVAKNAAIAIFRGDSSAALRWIEALPAYKIVGNPMVCITYAWALFLSNLSKFGSMPFETIEQLLKKVEKAYPGLIESEGPDSRTCQLLRAHVDALRVHLAYSRNEPREKVIESGLRTLEKFSENQAFVRTNIYFTLALTYLDIGDLDACARSLEHARSAALLSGLCYHVILSDVFRVYLAKVQGMLRYSAEISKNALKAVEQTYVNTHKLSRDVLGYYDLERAWRLYEKNQLQRASDTLNSAVESIRLLPEPSILQTCYRLMFHIRLYMGADKDSVLFPLKELEALGVYCLRAYSLAGALRIRYLLHREGADRHTLDAAFALAEQRGLVLDEMPSPEDNPYPVPFERLIRLIEQLGLIRLHIAAAGKPGLNNKALSIEAIAAAVDRVLERMRAEGFAEMEIEGLILQAVVRDCAGRRDSAIEALKKALGKAEPEGYLRVFVNEGRALQELLAQCRDDGHFGDYVNALLEAIEAECGNDPAVAGKTPEGQPELPEPLSSRENDVLKLIARGFSNQQIADELCVSLTTVKKHNYNIFRKLEVNRRMAAVEKARRLHLC